MKHTVILILLISSIYPSFSQVPNAKEWTRQKKTARKYMLNQISALKVYAEYLQTGYKIVDKGLTLIGDIQQGTLNLDKDYFNSLKQVNPLIRKSPKVNQILVNQKMIINEFKNLLEYSKKEPYLSSGDKDHINAVYKGMIKQGESAINELTIITTAGETEMKDDERLARLDKVHEALQDQYAFAKDFSDRTKLLAMQRKKEAHEVQSLRKLYKIQP